MEALVDSNVILDIVTADKRWASWSATAIGELYGVLAINPIIYAEALVGYLVMVILVGGPKEVRR